MSLHELLRIMKQWFISDWCWTDLRSRKKKNSVLDSDACTSKHDFVLSLPPTSLRAWILCEMITYILGDCIDASFLSPADWFVIKGSRLFHLTRRIYSDIFDHKRLLAIRIYWTSQRRSSKRDTGKSERIISEFVDSVRTSSQKSTSSCDRWMFFKSILFSFDQGQLTKIWRQNDSWLLNFGPLDGFLTLPRVSDTEIDTLRPLIRLQFFLVEDS